MNQSDDLIAAYLLDGNGGGQALDWAGVRAWRPDDGPIWVHGDRTGDAIQHWVSEESGIDSATTETLLRREGNRPRVHRVGNGLVVALRGVNRADGGELDDMPTMHIWIDAQRIISLRRRRLEAGERIRSDIEAGHGPKSPSEFLVKMTEYLVDPILPVVAELDDTIDQLQAEMLTKHGDRLRYRLQEARQEVISFRRHVAPQRDALARLQHEQLDWLHNQDRAILREIADYTTRYVEDLDAARERAVVTQDELNNQLAERMNKTMYLLTIVSALLLPPALITGLFGINVGGMPGVESETAFTIVAASIPVLAVVEYWVLRRMKWI